MNLSSLAGTYLGMVAITTMAIELPQLNQQSLSRYEQTVIAQQYPVIEELTFSSFFSVLKSGQFNASAEVIDVLGWNPSTQWLKGQTVDEYLPIGFFEDSLGIGQFSLNDIHQNSLQPILLEQLSLADIGFISNQTVGSLLESLSYLENERVRSLPLIQDALESVVNVSGKKSLKAVLEQYRYQLDVPLSDVVDLTSYSLDSLPGIENQPLNTFVGWQELTMEQIPNLAQVPFGNFPIPLVSGTLNFAYVDIVLNQHQNMLNRSVVGSYQQGFSVPCNQNCPHVEFSQPDWLKGSQWISGQTLSVEGGEGVLGSVNGGKEAAGRHPFGKAFKVSLWEVDELTGTADMVIFFNLCVKKTFVDLGCTPYIFGPIPWFPLQEGSWGVL